MRSQDLILYSYCFWLCRIIKSIKESNPSSRVTSNINEFNFIDNNIKSMMKATHDIHRDLTKKNQLLRNYSYINQLKGTNHNDIRDVVHTAKSFYIIVFQLTFTHKANNLLKHLDQNRTLNVIKEYIHVMLSEIYPDSVTFPMEKNQLVSLVFSESSQEVIQTLQNIKLLFSRDKEYCFLTIALEPTLRKSSEFDTVYEQTLEMLKQRKTE